MTGCGQHALTDIDHAQPTDTNGFEIRRMAKRGDFNVRLTSRFPDARPCGNGHGFAIDHQTDGYSHRLLSFVLTGISLVSFIRNLGEVFQQR